MVNNIKKAAGKGKRSVSTAAGSGGSSAKATPAKTVVEKKKEVAVKAIKSIPEPKGGGPKVYGSIRKGGYTAKGGKVSRVSVYG